ncbi:hypothetical protein EV363DRAFT_1218519 [Boletus edulis]|nr:hypothetical protein EV363DRAFT_1218519 [Boletus edulis]
MGCSDALGTSIMMTLPLQSVNAEVPAFQCLTPCSPLIDFVSFSNFFWLFD